MFVSWQLLRRIVTFLRSSLSISSILIRNALSMCNQHETNTLKRVGFSWLLIARESLCDTTQQSHSGHDHSRLCMLKTKNPTCDNHRHSRYSFGRSELHDLDKLRENAGRSSVSKVSNVLRLGPRTNNP